MTRTVHTLVHTTHSRAHTHILMHTIYSLGKLKGVNNKNIVKAKINDETELFAAGKIVCLRSEPRALDI